MKTYHETWKYYSDFGIIPRGSHLGEACVNSGGARKKYPGGPLKNDNI
jgi:hypothetical protein